jgi:hypothetical protein
LNAQHDLRHAAHVDSRYKVELAAEAQLVDCLKILLNLFVHKWLIPLPTCLPLREPKIKVIQIVMNRQKVIPFHDVELDNVYDDLKGNNNQLKEHVVHEVVYLNAVVAGNLSLLVKQPQQNNEITTVEQRHIVLCITGVQFDEWFDIFLLEIIFKRHL